MHETGESGAHHVPVSAGMPPLIKISAMIGFIMILAILGIVAGFSAHGHVWPAKDSPNCVLTGGKECGLP